MTARPLVSASHNHSGELPNELSRRVAAGELTLEQAANYQTFLHRVERAFLGHRIVTDNHYTRWFARGAATLDELRAFTVQFSVFSNQFLVAQLKKMINSESIEAMRSAKEILANEIGVIFKAPGRNGPGGRALSDEEKDRQGDPELVSTTGTVDGGTFRFRAGHFEWLLTFAQGLGLGFGELGKRRHGTAATLFFCDELLRLYGAEDQSVASGASFAIENWAAAGFWQELEDGLLRIKKERVAGLRLAFFTWHNRVEAQHADHTHAELEEIFFQPGFDPERFLASGIEMLDGLARFWDGLKEARLSKRARQRRDSRAA